MKSYFRKYEVQRKLFSHEQESKPAIEKAAAEEQPEKEFFESMREDDHFSPDQAFGCRNHAYD